MRRRSVRSTWNSNLPMLTLSPRRGTRPNCCITRPAMVSNPSSASVVEKCSLNSSMRVAPRTTNSRSPCARMFWSSSTSNSSSISPMICSMTSSMVMSPATPPYSSTTIAMWLRLPRNSLSSTLRRLASGTKITGRRNSRMSNLARAALLALAARSRSLASSMPTTSSLSPSTTGKREWPDSITAGRMLASVASRRMHTISARATIRSRACSSAMVSAPSTIDRASASSSPRL